MNLADIHHVYFVGVGGIGMSAIARWFRSQGVAVYGYDRVSSPLTQTLEREGIAVHYEDDVHLIADAVKNDQAGTLVVYTPAIQGTHSELEYFRSAGYVIMKRAEVLGVITKDKYTVGVAGTHGKTTTSSMLAHLLEASGFGCNAFIGGIMTNYASNLIMGGKDDVVVVEADEFDRSFLQLYPDIAIVTSVDPDHLDIYGDETEMLRTFNEYVGRTDRDGMIIMNSRVRDQFVEASLTAATVTYGADQGEVQVANLRISDGVFHFDYQHGDVVIQDLILSVPGYHNMENCVAAITAALRLGVDSAKIKEAVASYQGVKRRFEYIIRNDRQVFIDDYAHHPGEISAFITSVRALFPGRKLTAIFQPHLFSRTNDFASGFAEELSKVDELILLDIYPAREDPMPGVTSQLIFDQVTLENKVLIGKSEVVSELKDRELEVLVTIGAGDIDREVPKIKEYLEGKEVSHV